MKKWMSMLVLCLLTTLCALAKGESHVNTYTLDEGYNGYFVCEDYAGEAPADSARMFTDLLLEGDEVICGTVFQEHYHNNPGKVNRGGALMAVRREGRILLMSAKGEGEQWHAGIETDSFLPPDAEFSITTRSDGSLYAHLTIVYEQTAYEIRTESNGGAYLYDYSWTDEAGNEMRMDCYRGQFGLSRMRGKEEQTICEGDCIPMRLAAWTADALPRTQEELLAYLKAHPFFMEADEAYISGVNLREQATGESASWGKYTAKVKILGQRPGKMAPWYNVRVGNLDGWVSGVYLHKEGERDQMHIREAAMKVYPVGCAKTETGLFSAPGGDAMTALAEGALVHVLGERDGWLHVIIPREELTHETDWDGVYGFVKAGDMTVGISKTDAVWK